MFCPNCGAQIPDGSKFCGNCGARLDGAAQAPQQSAYQQPQAAQQAAPPNNKLSAGAITRSPSQPSKAPSPISVTPAGR